jgi:hypothetical protein
MMQVCEVDASGRVSLMREMRGRSDIVAAPLYEVVLVDVVGGIGGFGRQWVRVWNQRAVLIALTFGLCYHAGVAVDCGVSADEGVKIEAAADA